MPNNPIELDLARDRLAQLAALHRTAAMRPALVPRIGPTAWRGPAYELYVGRVDAIVVRLRDAARGLADAVGLARTEVLDAAG